MRISKLYMPAVTLAGVLALAACGGGNDMNGGGSGGGSGNGGGSGAGAGSGGGGSAAAALTGTGLVYDPDGANEIRVTKDNPYETPNGGTITCPVDECIVTVGAQRGTPVVTATGGATFSAKAPPRVSGATGTTSNSEGDWLSRNALVSGVQVDVEDEIELERTAAGRTVLHAFAYETGTGRDEDGPWVAPGADVGGFWTVSNATAPTDGWSIQELLVDETEAPGTDLTEGLDTKVRLTHTRGRGNGGLIEDADRQDDYLVFGTWETTARSGLNPDGYPQAGARWAGSIPYTTRIRTSTGTARYVGTALGHYRNSASGNPGAKAAWAEWEGNVQLDADFTTDQIEGTVYTNITGNELLTGNASATGAFPTLGTISLGQTRIQENVDGTAKIAGSTDATGSWDANFYGTRAIQGQPSGVAGGFKSTRPHVAIVFGSDGNAYVSGQSGATVQGAFGAHNTGQLEVQTEE
ncbi:MAG: hypothetical protein OXC25_13270 [Thiotrichales bacterium]|nr:hypothetical protein [Thiotrichales bacterium]